MQKKELELSILIPRVCGPDRRQVLKLKDERVMIHDIGKDHIFKCEDFLRMINFCDMIDKTTYRQ